MHRSQLQPEAGLEPKAWPAIYPFWAGCPTISAPGCDPI
jgi:hypothetical protein